MVFDRKGWAASNNPLNSVMDETLQWLHIKVVVLSCMNDVCSKMQNWTAGRHYNNLLCYGFVMVRRFM